MNRHLRRKAASVRRHTGIQPNEFASISLATDSVGKKRGIGFTRKKKNPRR